MDLDPFARKKRGLKLIVFEEDDSSSLFFYLSVLLAQKMFSPEYNSLL